MELGQATSGQLAGGSLAPGDKVEASAGERVDLGGDGRGDECEDGEQVPRQWRRRPWLHSSSATSSPASPPQHQPTGSSLSPSSSLSFSPSASPSSRASLSPAAADALQHQHHHHRRQRQRQHQRRQQPLMAAMSPVERRCWFQENHHNHKRASDDGDAVAVQEHTEIGAGDLAGAGMGGGDSAAGRHTTNLVAATGNNTDASPNRCGGGPGAGDDESNKQSQRSAKEMIGQQRPALATGAAGARPHQTGASAAALAPPRPPQSQPLHLHNPISQLESSKQQASPSPTFMSSASSTSSGYQSPSMFTQCQAQHQLHHQAQQQQAKNNGQQQQANNNYPELANHSNKLDAQQQQLQLAGKQLQVQQQPLKRQYPPNHPLGNTKHLCSICGDRATGKHYGVYSCEGCKGFFKRTIRKDIVYACRATGNCLIDMLQRNRCQYCRYQKCLSQGMKREAVQEEKQRLKLRACATNLASLSAANNQTPSDGGHCDSRLVSSDTTTTSTTNSNLMIGQQQSTNFNTNTYAYHQQQQQHPNGYQASNKNPFNAGTSDPQQQQQQQQIHLSDIVEAQLNVCESIGSQNNNFAESQQPPISNHLNQPASITNYQASNYHHQYNSNNHNHQVMREYNNNTYYADEHYQPPRKLARIDDLTLKWAAQVQIEQLLEWAKSVPKFTELLVDDQMTLLRAYWNELIISDIAFKSIEAHKENQNRSGIQQRSLCIARGLFINESQAYEIGLGNMFDRIISELVVKMHDMRLDANELACLRAIILFNPETHGLKTSRPIEVYRSQVYTALEMYCRKHYQDQPNRFGKLLLRLPALRSIGLKCDSMRRCDKNNNNYSSSITTSNNNTTASNNLNNGASSPNNNNNSTANMLGYHVKLLFFDICYEASVIDSFLISNLTNNT